MMATGAKKNAKYDYLILSCKLTRPEWEIWEALFEQDRVILSANIYSLIARERPALMEAARCRQPRNDQKTHVRKLFLLPLPQYRDVIRFVRCYIRRPAFKEHLKNLILYQNEQADRILASLARNSPLEGTPVPELVMHVPLSPEPVMAKQAKRSPRELFSEPNKLLQIMVLDLKRPEPERLFIWDAIPPDEYPEAMRRTAPFSRLERFWKEAKNIA